MAKSAYVRKVQRASLPYTITAIGGPREHKLWQEAQIEADNAYNRLKQPIRAARRDLVISYVADQNAPQKPLTAQEQAEVNRLVQIALEDQQRNRGKNKPISEGLKEILSRKPYAPTRWESIKSYIKILFKEAFGNY